MSTSSHDDRQFRRGIVLGLTMAEILLLLIFLLMLILASKLLDQRKQIDREHAGRALAEHKLAQLRPILTGLGFTIDQPFDITKEWERLKQEAAAARAELTRYEAAVAMVKRREATGEGKPEAVTANIEREAANGRRFLADAASMSPGLPPESAMSEYEKTATTGKELLSNGRDPKELIQQAAVARAELTRYHAAVAMVKRRETAAASSPEALVADIERESGNGRRFLADALGMSPGLQPDPAMAAYENSAAIGKEVLSEGGDPRELLQQTSVCKNELSTCKAQTINLSRRLGGVLPPCWVDQNGKTQYIFDAHLREQGIYLIDNKIAGRESDQRSLPISGFKFETPMSAEEFVRAGMPLLQVSEKQECRFYVRAYDDTGANSKARYKALLRGVEGIFYKLLVQ